MDTQITLKNNSRMKGILLVVSASMLWGVSGPVAQYLFQKKDISPEWLVDIRLLLSGSLLLIFLYLKNGKKIFNIWKSKYGRRNIIFFSIIGLIGVQYGYFASIKYGNAATATILQYLSPVIIVCYVSFKSKELPTLRETLSILLALLGTFLLITRGNIHSLAISNLALFWGVLSAFAAAFYVVQPVYIIKRWGCDIVIGWGMLLGGIFFSFVHPFWRIQGEYSTDSILAITFVVVFGTLVSFYWYLDSTRYIKASETSLLSCLEPMSATTVSILWLHTPFGIFDIIGSILILSTVLILSYNKKS
ncbi:DMT family transporter [Clostridium ljungdahlii]|uniref:Inner membrane transporter YicL n=1 Tax=Clostridium ljungdahlii (strain ATCC 55383 / DSM 13528 / PETC) TaxID=748727 RepID=D8GNA4_CLOLD|nr:DMT family transporter [Clostridium ljungdahlii]ADK13728.1 predicted permease [Clostridium ljungdahlii DSM 13528]OAA84975.1 putative inner membrane transporter YicL [Clostridium ljungdahlii DSM 13528]